MHEDFYIPQWSAVQEIMEFAAPMEVRTAAANFIALLSVLNKINVYEHMASRGFRFWFFLSSFRISSLRYGLASAARLYYSDT